MNGPKLLECPRCNVLRGHDSDCARHNEPAYPAGACDCTLSKPDPVAGLLAALVAIAARAPAAKPDGPYDDWGYLRSDTPERVMSDGIEADRWEAAEIARAALSTLAAQTAKDPAAPTEGHDGA